MNARRIIVAGLIASVAMGMVEMIYEALAGDGFWAPVTYIGATILRGLQALRPPVGFHVGGVVLGLAGHMMNSVIFGWMFVALIGRRAVSRGPLIVTGAIYGLAVYFVMWSLIVPVVDPVMSNLNATVFALAHLVWGMMLGWLVPQPAAAVARAPAV